MTSSVDKFAYHSEPFQEFKLTVQQLLCLAEKIPLSYIEEALELFENWSNEILSILKGAKKPDQSEIKPLKDPIGHGNEKPIIVVPSVNTNMTGINVRISQRIQKRLNNLVPKHADFTESMARNIHEPCLITAEHKILGVLSSGVGKVISDSEYLRANEYHDSKLKDVITMETDVDKNKDLCCRVEDNDNCSTEVNSSMIQVDRSASIGNPDEETSNHQSSVFSVADEDLHSDNLDNFIHLTVERADGTVDNLKIAGIIDPLDKSSEHPYAKQNIIIASDDYLSQIKEEKVDTEKASKKRSRGRPKTGRVSEPVINEHGHTVYVCKVCSARVQTTYALEAHMRIHTGDRPFTCKYCGKSFTTKGNAKAHEITHSDKKPFQCSYCDKRFKEKKVKIVHERVHTGEKPYVCEICNKGFSQRSVLSEHMCTHSNKKPHLCDHCGQGFRGLSALKAHHRRHQNEKDFKCEIDNCSMAFVSRNELKRHVLTHTGDRPYTCVYCPKAFTRLSYLKEHLNTHTGEKPFRCQFCGEMFSNSMSLHRHKKKHIPGMEMEQTYSIVDGNIVTVNNENVSAAQFITEDNSIYSPVSLMGQTAAMNENKTSVHFLLDDGASEEDLASVRTFLMSTDFANNAIPAKQYYQVVCVNPLTQEVGPGQVITESEC